MFSLYNQLKDRSKRSGGFTIVELLIVIVVIGILATLVIVTFTGIQQKGRNSQRETDLKAIQSHVSAFYADKGYYPTQADLVASGWISTNMKGLDAEALKDPKQASGTTIGTSTTATANSYNYVATGASDCNNANQTNVSGANIGCDGYTLNAQREGGAAITITGN